MKVNSNYKRDISFNGFINSNFLKKGLEFAAKDGTLFAATTTLVFSTTARPLAIMATPKTDKKSREVACAKSITSTALGYFLAFLCSTPISNSIKKISDNPKKFLTKEAIEVLKGTEKELTASKAYSLATQIFKLGVGFVIAVPKSILTAFGTPYTLNLLSKENKAYNNEIENINFKGKDSIAKNIGKVLNKKSYQDFAKKYKDSNFPMHIMALTDSLSTATFIYQTAKNKQLEKKEKNILNYNAIISTTLSILTSYIIDKLTSKSTENFIKKYKKANFNDPNLVKQVEGIKIAKPILILASVYYILIPIISTFLADKIKNIVKE